MLINEVKHHCKTCLRMKKILELTARLYVFIFLNIYGWGKILGGQFYRRGKLPEEVATLPLGEVDAFTLGWTFMGYSYAYILFIGISQIIGAFLLVFEKTKLLGVAILLPILLNIIVFDLIFLDRLGALASATLYFLLLIAILGLNFQRVEKAFQALTKGEPIPIKTLALSAKWKQALIVLIALALVVWYRPVLCQPFG
jgi:hypothetical protein